MLRFRFPPLLARSLAAGVLVPSVWLAASAHALESRSDVLVGTYEDGSLDPALAINLLVGAGTFYQAGYFGGNTVVANVEAGHIWGGHEVFDRTALSGRPPSPALLFNAARDPVTAPDLGDYDFHATMVGHVLAGTGYVGSGDFSALGAGMVPLTTVWSGAVATRFDRSEENLGAFEISDESFLVPYRAFFEGTLGQKPDVINSSWSFDDPAATAKETRILDALAAENPTVALVKSAGNSSPTAPPGGPGSGFNGITVGSLGGLTDANPFLRPSEFSSGRAADFYDPATGVTHTAVRAAVDLSAPGENLVLAAYLGKSGSLAELSDVIGPDGNPAPDLYFLDMAGTSFAAPIVAGGIALLKDVAKGGAYLVGQPEALDTRVIKSVLQAGAIPTAGWNNGQHLDDGVTVTTQALDLVAGAGRVDLDRSANLYVNGTTDVPGLGGGEIAVRGWDLGEISLGGATEYVFPAVFPLETTFVISLNWFVNDGFNGATGLASYGSFANLDLSLWAIVGGLFDHKVASSESLYGNSEFLRVNAAGGAYGLRVTYSGNVYDLTGSHAAETYGLAWTTTPVPEPATWGAMLGLALLIFAARRGRKLRLEARAQSR